MVAAQPWMSVNEARDRNDFSLVSGGEVVIEPLPVPPAPPVGLFTREHIAAAFAVPVEMLGDLSRPVGSIEFARAMGYSLNEAYHRVAFGGAG